MLEESIEHQNKSGTGGPESCCSPTSDQDYNNLDTNFATNPNHNMSANMKFCDTQGADGVELSFDEDEPLVNKSHLHGVINMFSPNGRKSMGASTNLESESQLSMRHLSEAGKAIRTSDPVSSLFNMLNMYVGIALIALPKAVSEVGFVAAIIGLIIVNLISLGASYFLLKARNRFKKQRIIDFPDMAMACYGPATKRVCEMVLILANTTFAMAQGMYLGGQADLFACDWLDRPTECGQHRNFYSFVMITLMSPLLLINDFKKLASFSGFFIMCCVVAIICIFAFEILTIYKRANGEPLEMTYSDESGKVAVASEEKLATAFDYEYFNFATFPLFMGEVLSIFEGNVGILNIYS